MMDKVPETFGLLSFDRAHMFPRLDVVSRALECMALIQEQSKGITEGF